MRNIIINSKNVVPNTNNSRYSYKFPVSQKFEDMQIALGNFNYNQSVFNITTTNNNTVFQYQFPTEVNPTTVSMPEGLYRLQDINAYLEFTQFQNKHYLIDGLGNIVYFISLTVNRVLYGYEISCDPVPTALPAGWASPVGFPGFPAVAETPLLIIPSTKIQQLLGFPAATYPAVAQATTYNLLSPNVPQIFPVSSILLACSLVHNDLQYPNQIFYSFLNSDQVAGTPISITPSEYAFINLDNGYYHSLEIEILDQNFKPIALKDPDVLFNLLLCQRCTPIAKSSFYKPLKA